MADELKTQMQGVTSEGLADMAKTAVEVLLSRNTWLKNENSRLVNRNIDLSKQARELNEQRDDAAKHATSLAAKVDELQVLLAEQQRENVKIREWNDNQRKTIENYQERDHAKCRSANPTPKVEPKVVDGSLYFVVGLR